MTMCARVVDNGGASLKRRSTGMNGDIGEIVVEQQPLQFLERRRRRQQTAFASVGFRGGEGPIVKARAHADRSQFAAIDLKDGGQALSLLAAGTRPCAESSQAVRNETREWFKSIHEAGLISG